MKRNILILEDKREHMEALYKIVSEVALNTTVYMASNVHEAYKVIMENHIHLFMVDIILCPESPGDVQGLQFAQEIREIKKYRFTPLIFITSLEDPKYFSYSQLNCMSYIEKPFSPTQVRKAIMKALEFPITNDLERFVYFRKDGIVYGKCIKDIVYIENMHRKIVIYCRNDNLEIPYKTCKEILKDLDSKLFIQCSRFAIVNRQYIQEIDYVNRYVKLQYVNKLIEIGVTMKKRFMEQMEENE